MKLENKILIALRLTIGWLFFFAGISKLTNPDWSAAGYLASAHTFSDFYTWLASEPIIGITNALNAWGLTLIGLALLVGLFTRLTSLLGVILMILYWFPGLRFPAVEHGMIVDEHIVYAVLLFYLAIIRAGRVGGLDSKLPQNRWLG